MRDESPDASVDAEAGSPFSVLILVDEWHRILEWLHCGLAVDEREATGHFLLECSGTGRTWVASNGDRWLIAHGDGPTPTGLADRNEQVSILVNSRFFRSRRPEDVTLTVTPTESGRRQTMRGDGFEMTLPEHPGPFPEWRTIVAAVKGTDVVVDAEQLVAACRSAAVPPMGVEQTEPLHAWMFGGDGRLVLHAPWVHFPDTVVRMTAERPVPDTVPTLIAPRALVEIVEHLGSNRFTLTLPPTALHPVGVRADGYQAVLLPVDRWGRPRARLEELLCEFLGVESVHADGDGDYPIITPQGNSLWVRLHTGVEPVSVQVFSVLATDVDAGEDLLRELNSINADGAYVKVIWATGAVMAEHDLVAETLDLAELANAVQQVSSIADRYRDVLSAFFGSAGVDDGDGRPR